MRTGVVVCAIASAAVIVGCDGVRRHDMLTFFFDGVDEPIQDQWEHERAMRAAAYALEGQDDAREPYAMNPCSECHAPPETVYASVSPDVRERSSAAPSVPAPAAEARAGAQPRTQEPVGGLAAFGEGARLSDAAHSPFVISAAEDRASVPPVVPSSEGEARPSPLAVAAAHEAAPSLAVPAEREEAPSPRPAPRSLPPSVASIAKASPESLAGARAKVAGINLQVAAFTNGDNATALKNTLQREFATVRIDELSAHGRLWYRVRIGPLATNAEADRAEARLRAMGHAPVRYGRAQRSE